MAEPLKNAISLRSEIGPGTVSGRPTLSTLYAGSLAVVGLATLKEASLGQIALVVTPFFLFLMSELGFSTAVLPNLRTPHLPPVHSHSSTLECPINNRIERKAYPELWRSIGVGLFWTAVLTSISIVMFFGLRHL
jgi:hypothetical protein